MENNSSPETGSIPLTSFDKAAFSIIYHCPSAKRLLAFHAAYKLLLNPCIPYNIRGYIHMEGKVCMPDGMQDTEPYYLWHLKDMMLGWKLRSSNTSLTTIKELIMTEEIQAITPQMELLMKELDSKLEMMAAPLQLKDCLLKVHRHIHEVPGQLQFLTDEQIASLVRAGEIYKGEEIAVTQSKKSTATQLKALPKGKAAEMALSDLLDGLI